MSVVFGSTVLTALANLFNNGTLSMYGGTRPASPDIAPGSDPLLTVALPVLAFNTGTRQITTAGQWFGTVGNAGTATWFRLADNDGLYLTDGDITATGGGGDITLSSTSFVFGAVVQITAFTITLPSGS
jgi:hypothetical protein